MTKLTDAERAAVGERNDAVRAVHQLSAALGDACLIRFVGPSGVAEIETLCGKYRAKPKQRRCRRCAELRRAREGSEKL